MTEPSAQMIETVLADEGWCCDPYGHEDGPPAVGECSECDRMRGDTARRVAEALAAQDGEVDEFIQCPHEAVRTTCAGVCNCPCDKCAPARPVSPTPPQPSDALEARLREYVEELRIASVAVPGNATATLHLRLANSEHADRIEALLGAAQGTCCEHCNDEPGHGHRDPCALCQTGSETTR